MAIKFALVFSLFTLTCFYVWAAPPEVQVRSEESRWITEVIVTGADGWPEVRSRQSYPTQKQAEVQKQFLMKNLPPEFFSSAVATPQTVKGVIWKTTQSWSEDWERRYAHWIENEVDTEFFVRYNIATDCADVAYSLRWIFSRIHGLPAAATLGGGKALLTNETLRGNWSSLPTAEKWYQDRRFLAALNYLLDMTYTHTLWGDSFPVALTKDSLLSGSYHLSLGTTTGHTQVIHWLNSDEGVPFLTLNSTVPRKVRSLSDSMLFGTKLQDRKEGLLRFRWAVKNSAGIALKKATEMPGYSLEQFSFRPEKDLSIALFEKLGYTGGQEGIRDYIYKDLLAQFKARVEIVREGLQQCQKIKCDPGTVGWEDWGTPSRDSRIKGKIASLYALMVSTETSVDLKQTVLETEGVPWSLEALIWNWQNDEFNSDPRVNENHRWGAGGVSWVEGVSRFFAGKIQERQEVLKKGAQVCAGKDCRFGSSLWKQTSSTDVDTQIKAKIYYVENGGSLLPATLSADLMAKMDNEIGVVNGRPLTLRRFFELAATMNSSAQASPAQQWGEGEGFAVRTGAPPSVIQDRWLLQFSRGRAGVLWDLQARRQMTLDFQIQGHFSGTSLLLVKEAQRNALYDLASSSRKPLSENLQGLDLAKALLGRDHMYVPHSDHLAVWNLDSKNLDLVWKADIPGADWRFIGGGFFTNDRALLDADKQQIYTVPVSQILCMAPDFAVFGGSALVLIDRNTKQIQSARDVPIVNAECERREVLIYENQKTTLFHVNDKLVREPLREFPGVCFFADAVTINCQGGEQYKLSQGRWEKVNGTTAKYSVKAFIDRPWELIDNRTRQVLYTGKFISLQRDRYVSLLPNEGRWGYVIDLENPRVPLLTEGVRTDHGASMENMGPGFFISGYGHLSSGLFWLPPQP